MTDLLDARAWFDAFFADVVNGTFTLIASLCLVYLFSVARNLADPGKHGSVQAKGVAAATAVLVMSLVVVFLRGNSGQPEATEPLANHLITPAAIDDAASDGLSTSNEQSDENNDLLNTLTDFNNRLEEIEGDSK